ncbi:MAG: ATP-dependent DNA helicase RecG [Calditrichaeota bacterium]|nr:ATP-dependent DNA helicase RecG [Calditrichota bacterium]
MAAPAKEKKAAPPDLPVLYVRGVGPRKGEAFERAGVHTLRDLLYYVPRRYIDRTTATRIGSLRGETKGEVTVIGRITDARLVSARGGKSRYEALLSDGTGDLKLVWFRQTNKIRRWIREGYAAAFSGKVNLYGGFPQIAHPEVMALSRGEMQDLREGRGRWIALYPGGQVFEKVGLEARPLRNLMDRIVGEYNGCLPEIWPDSMREQLALPRIREAIELVHRPHNRREKDRGWLRLKFDELFILQLLWAWTRRRTREQTKGIAYPAVRETTRALIEKKLPFELTGAQKRVLREIWADMKRPHPMTRLLQGDVGSGKTVVALVAMTIAVENGFQAVLMAPTEILAEQHFLTSRKFIDDLEVPVELLVGGSGAKQRREKLAQLAAGKPGITIGTHALIQEAVQIPKLGLAVIDEQHRFGVAQRLTLMHPGRTKGSAGAEKPDVLVMTATPIPRSLALAIYGDLEVSRLDEMPPGRGTVQTSAHNANADRRRIYEEVAKRVRAGDRAYIIFPLVQESEKVDLAAAQQGREELLRGPFKGLAVGLLHGRMPVDEKGEAMAAFASGQTPVLVSTTVVEVGVDVPEATLMVVEHAERFGLAQLHQLRGRIGRGGRDGRCWLLAYPPVTQAARARLQTMIRTTDGFVIAEEDLRIRGAGDYFGVRQSGLPPLRFADIVEDHDLAKRARQVADDILARSRELTDYPALRDEFRRVALGKATWLEAG